MDSSEYDSEERRNTTAGRRTDHYSSGIRGEIGISRKYRDAGVSYTYEPLPRAHGVIRILELHSSEQPDAGVRCELITPSEDERRRYPYEALSWCWGTSKRTERIQIQRKGRSYMMFVTPTLLAALKALRYPYGSRYLWIDMVCIDQNDLGEKNHQVEMMNIIYGNAKRVRIWLGTATKSSHVAIQFIRKEISRLQSFDTLCESKEASQKWLALLELMQRPWFSRRWVIQELAFAQDSIIHCGADQVSWDNFAIAVELFVEAETSTHRLSEAMKVEQVYRRTPNYFDHVSELGASLLVNAAKRLFRDYEIAEASESSVGGHITFEHPADSESDSLSSAMWTASDSDGFSDESEDLRTSQSRVLIKNARSHTKPRQQPLLSLEYLVSSLTIFDTTVPHDTIYALLSLSKNTIAQAVEPYTTTLSTSPKERMDSHIQRVSYPVDYRLPYVNVCKDFVHFSIEQSLHGNAHRALDVICRPWAIEESRLQKIRDIRQREKVKEDRKKRREKDLEARRRGRESRRVHASRLISLDLSGTAEREDMALPSWIPQLSNAPCAMAEKPGLTGPKMSRINADPLVGLPSPAQPNFTAAGARGVDMRSLRFRKRPYAGNFSMYLRGFRLDVITRVTQVARHGQIPSEWAQFVGWDNARGRPPQEFWRTLVANRGIDGRSAPAYYSRACTESFRKGGIKAGAIDLTGLIELERNSIITQFCRRVQAVTWNRALVRTSSGTLGLVGKDVQKDDLVCILYGCSVPVVLRESLKKTEAEFQDEMKQELVYVRNTIVQKLRQCIVRKRQHEAWRDKEMAKMCRVWLRTSDYMRSHGIDSTKLPAKDMQGITHILQNILKHATNDFKSWLWEERRKAWPAIEFRAGEKVKERKEHPRRKVNRPGKKETDEELRMQSSRKRRESVGAATLLRRNAIEPTTTDDATSTASKYGFATTRKMKPLVDWWEFELALVAGRRWLQEVRRRKFNRIHFALQYSEEEWRKQQWNEYDAVKKLIERGNQEKIERQAYEHQYRVTSERSAHNGGMTSHHQIVNKESGSNGQPEREDEQHRSVQDDGSSHEHGENGGPGSTEEHGKTETETEIDTYDGDQKAKETPHENRETPQASSSSSRPRSFTRNVPPRMPTTIRPSWRHPINKTKLTDGEASEYDTRIEENLRNRLGDEGYYSYTFLGECYIHGMMDGEAIQHQNEEVIPSTVFEIR